MNARKFREDALRALRARIEDEDGTRPEPWREGRREQGAAPSRKDLQLCGQVARAIESALASGQDALLRELRVIAVEPAPNAGRLRVIVGPCGPSGPAPRGIEAALARARGYVRAEVAGSISRKRVPELIFAAAAWEEEAREA
jgi:ribosome-binding factor A